MRRIGTGDPAVGRTARRPTRTPRAAARSAGSLPWLSLLAIGLALWLASSPSAQQKAQPATGTARTALVLTIEGAIGPATADYVRRGFERAVEREAAAIVLRIDTPGGLDTSMREIIRQIVNAPMPVLAWVGPSGARAASAGTYILYASHVAAMAPGTNLGAATPVAIGGGGQPTPGRDDRGDRDAADERNGSKKDRAGGDEARDGANADDERGKARDDDDKPARRDRSPAKPASAMEAKATNDAVAYIRSLAELRGRNADWAEAAVREAASLSARAARDRQVVDLVVGSIDELLEQAHGRTVRLGEGQATLDTRDLVREALEPDWRNRLLGVITNPNVALILMMIGFYGLIFEFMNPGALYPGTIGAISLLVGLYALAALPINIAGLALIVLGLALMVAEAFTPSVGILGIGGIVSFVLGSTILIDAEFVPGFAVSWPLVAGLAAGSLALTLLIARLALKSRHGAAATGAAAMIGARVIVLDWSAGAGHVFVRGERWNAVSDQPLQAGSRATITGVEGLTLHVRAEQDIR